MTLFARHGSCICLLGFVCLMVSTEVRAQSHEGVRKRAFAELLARKAKAVHAAEARRELAAAERAPKQTTRTISLARSTAVLPRAAVSVANATGVASATPVNPSGFGSGRDAFVETYYSQVLNRNPGQSELDYWSGTLARGVAPNVVSTIIWRSQEHRTQVRNGLATGIPEGTAYRNALAVGRANRQR